MDPLHRIEELRRLVRHHEERYYVLDQPEIAASLGMTEGAVRFAAFKLRERYRGALKEIVTETVVTDEEVAEELAHLRTLFQSP